MLIRRLTSVVVACTCISSQANAQDSDRDCGNKPGDAPAQEALTERAALAGDLLEMLEELEQDAPAFRTMEAMCPEVVRFLGEPFSSSVSPPSTRQLKRAIVVMQGLQAADTSLFIPNTFQMDNLVSVVASTGRSIPAVFDPAAVAPAVADFLVQRAQDEVVYSFVLNLGSQIEGAPFVRLGFPHSYALMQEIRVGTFQTLMPAVRSAADRDLQRLPQVLGTDSVVDALRGYFPSHLPAESVESYLVGVGLVFKHGAALGQGSQPAAVLSSLIEDAAALEHDVVGRVALRIVGAVAREMSLDHQSLTSVLEDRARRTYLAAFLADEVLRREGWSRSTREAVQTLEFINQQQEALVRLGQHLTATGELAAYIRSPDEASGGAVSMAFAQVLQTFSAALALVPVELQTDTRFTRLAAAASDALRLNQALAARDYSSLIGWVLGQPALRNAAGPVGTRYLLFATNLTAAQTAEEVTVALRNAADPVGSYRTKRNQFEPPADWNVVRSATSPNAFGPVTVSLTGFVAAAYGSEETEGLPSATESREQVTSDFYGLSLPVGLELSFGVPFGSVSLFAPVLDVGTVTSRRRGGSDQIEDEAEVGWNQILAPGLFLSVGFRNVPLVLGYGVQQVADLRETTDGTATVDVTRRQVFVGVDVTVFNLFKN